MLKSTNSHALRTLALSTPLLMLGGFASVSNAADCKTPDSVTSAMIQGVVNKGPGSQIYFSEFKSMLDGRTTLNVSSYSKYADMLGIPGDQKSRFKQVMTDVDVKCSTPNGHFDTELLFGAFDVTNNNRITTSDRDAVSSGSDSGGGDNTGGTDTSGTITHIGTTQVWDSNGQNVTVSRPSGTRKGDLMVLALHRTDDMLPFAVSGWKRAAECYKEDNGYDCVTVKDCTDVSGNFCNRFKNKYRGRDLAQVIFHKTAGSSEPSAYSFDLNKDASGHPGWAILTTLRGANTSSPVRDWAYKGCDQNADSLFPSVYGKKGDMLLLSQSFDDAVSKSKFGAPSGMSTFGYVSNSDEAGFMYGGIVSRDGETGSKKTSGSGASSCKDALVSITIKAQ